VACALVLLAIAMATGRICDRCLPLTEALGGLAHFLNRRLGGEGDVADGLGGARSNWMELTGRQGRHTAETLELHAVEVNLPKCQIRE